LVSRFSKIFVMISEVFFIITSGRSYGKRASIFFSNRFYLAWIRVNFFKMPIFGKRSVVYVMVN
jgi:hypothetical protein